VKIKKDIRLGTIMTSVKSRIFVSKDISKFTVIIETPSKAFSDWTFPKVCQLYGLDGETEDPTMAVFPVFSCGNIKPTQESLEGLMAE
jgi:hypothetical protein